MKVPQILAVVVRHETALEDSQTIAGLSAALQEPYLAQEISILLWDNSPCRLEDVELPFPSEYHWSEENRGTAGAYNGALQLAEQRGIPWLLLLDQDTDVTAVYLRRMVELSLELDQQTEIASIVPFIRSFGLLASPRRFKPFNRSIAVERRFNGILRDSAYAVNSASVMRVVALREIGGYNEDFWLDLSDVYAFEQLHQRGKTIYVAGDVELNHAIGGFNFEAEMIPVRYEQFLSAEGAYVQMFRSLRENIFLTLWLPLRGVRQYFKYRDKRFAHITWRYALMRINRRPAARLAIWLKQLRENRTMNRPTRSEA